MLSKMVYNSTLGDIVLLSDNDYLLGLWFKGQKYFGSHYKLDTALVTESEPIRLAERWLDKYFAGENPDIYAVPVKPEVTTFRRQVIQILRGVPYGRTITYKQLSDQLQKNSPIKINKARAIGNAISHNPILLLIPCHRVVGSNHSLTGYAAGIERKRALLTMEQKAPVLNKERYNDLR